MLKADARRSVDTDREAKLASTLLQQVRAELGRTLAVCEGTEKATNDLRELMSDLNKGERLSMGEIGSQL